MRTFDAVVLGLGSMGSFACLELAERGLRVAGFDAFSPPHGRGSHSGDTRIFRVAYAEHPDYVPLAQRAGSLWAQRGLEFGAPLLTRSGMLSIGPADGELIAGIRKSALAHNLAIEDLPVEEIRRRYPAFAPPEGSVGVFEQTAGWLNVPASIEGALKAACRRGAHIFNDTPIASWKACGDRIMIETSRGTIETARLVITAGAGAAAFLRDLQLPLTVQRKTLTWIQPLDPANFLPAVFPIFAIADDFFYGFPDIAGQGVKLAIHWRKGPTIDDPLGYISPAGEDDFASVIRMANRYLPGLTHPLPEGLSRIRRGATCLYTMTPDEHFIIDRHPALENVWFAAGFSGHGFKFAPAIGEALAELSTAGRTALPVEFLRMGNRFRANNQGRAENSTPD